MKLIIKNSNITISEDVMVANSFFKRFKGLMFSKELPEDKALYIIPCSEIHTFNMKYSIDVLYLDKNNNIIYLDENMKPGKIGRHVKNGSSIIEIPSGKVKNKGIKIGQTILFI